MVGCWAVKKRVISNAGGDLSGILCKWYWFQRVGRKVRVSGCSWNGDVVGKRNNKGQEKHGRGRGKG